MIKQMLPCSGWGPPPRTEVRALGQPHTQEGHQGLPGWGEAGLAFLTLGRETELREAISEFRLEVFLRVRGHCPLC